MSHKLLKCTGFQWDKGNLDKNWILHQVKKLECEQIFFNQPLLLGDDKKHSKIETRYFALGKADEGRRLFIICTIRKNLIRIISARDMNKKEKEVYLL